LLQLSTTFPQVIGGGAMAIYTMGLALLTNSTPFSLWLFGYRTLVCII
jgi:hypothetical protein